MNVVFFSSSSNFYDGKTFHYSTLPTNCDLLSRFLNLNSEIKLFIVTQKPGLFLLDLYNGELLQKNAEISYKILDEKASVKDFVSSILEVSPDFVIPLTFWMPPFDWFGLNDSLIAEKLSETGLKVLSSPLKAQKICFDKRLTSEFLAQNGFNCSKSVFVDHELFWQERNRHEIHTNFYKNAVLDEISRLKLPIIIKDVSGLSSFGMEVCKTFGEAKNFLTSKKNNSHRLVEEYLEGKHFGCEIYVDGNNTVISGPFAFSVNQYGITSPKQSVKLGPVKNQLLKLDELFSELKRLASLLQIKGVFQTDLLFDGNNWFIIEVNLRLSGLSLCVQASKNQTVYELLYGKTVSNVEKTVLDFKLPLVSKELLVQIKNEPGVEFVSQTRNDIARQEREAGYTEVVLACESASELLEHFEAINRKYSDIMEESFYKSAKELFSEYYTV